MTMTMTALMEKTVMVIVNGHSKNLYLIDIQCV